MGMRLKKLLCQHQRREASGTSTAGLATSVAGTPVSLSSLNLCCVLLQVLRCLSVFDLGSANRCCSPNSPA